MNKINVLFINSWYPNKVLPFNGNFVQQHAKAVSKYCNVFCLQTQSRNQNSSFIVSKNNNEGLKEITVYYKKINSSSIVSTYRKKQRQHKAFLKGFEAIISERINIDILHLNVIYPAGMFATFLNRKYNIPIVITEHSTSYLSISSSSFSFLEKFIIKRISKKAEIICPVSKDLENSMKRLGLKGSYRVVPNVINTNYFKFKESKNNNKINIVHISSLKEEHKNVKGIINVIGKLSKIRQDFILNIVTDGKIESIVQYAININLSDSFYSIEQNKSAEEIALILQRNHLFLLFSNFENLPCVIIEALACGLPVLSSDVGGINEMISKKNGVLVEQGNEKQLLYELERMINNLSFYDRESISASAIKRYSYESVGFQFFKIYKEVLNKRNNLNKIK